VKELTHLQSILLELGLEDLIPLPEISTTVEIRALPADTATIPQIAIALVELLRRGLIQVWIGHWSEDPQLAGGKRAERLILDAEQYRFNSDSDEHLRVYYVNVENLQA
jgi:hypothetical protein